MSIVFKYLCSAPQQPWAHRGDFGSISSKKRQVLRSGKEVERLDDKKEAQADGGRRFQREGPATEKDLDLAIVVLVRGTKSSRLSRGRRGRRDEAEVGTQSALEFFPIHCPNGRLGQDLGFGGIAFALKLPELLNTNLAAVRAKILFP